MKVHRIRHCIHRERLRLEVERHAGVLLGRFGFEHLGARVCKVNDLGLAGRLVVHELNRDVHLCLGLQLCSVGRRQRDVERAHICQLVAKRVCRPGVVVVKFVAHELAYLQLGVFW